MLAGGESDVGGLPPNLHLSDAGKVVMDPLRIILELGAIRKTASVTALQVSSSPALQVSRGPALEISNSPGCQVSKSPALQLSRSPGLQVSSSPNLQHSTAGP